MLKENQYIVKKFIDFLPDLQQEQMNTENYDDRQRLEENIFLTKKAMMALKGKALRSVDTLSDWQSWLRETDSEFKSYHDFQILWREKDFSGMKEALDLLSLDADLDPIFAQDVQEFWNVVDQLETWYLSGQNIYALESSQIDTLVAMSQWLTNYVSAPYFGFMKYYYDKVLDINIKTKNTSRNRLNYHFPKEKVSSFSVVPNPGSSCISFSGIIGKFDIEFFDLTGSSLLKAKQISGKFCDITELKDGMYFIHVSSARGKNIVKWIKE